MPELSKPNAEVEKETATNLSRRGFLVTASAAAASGITLAQGLGRPGSVRIDTASLPPYGHSTIPPGIRSRSVATQRPVGAHAGSGTSAGRPACSSACLPECLQLAQGE